MPPGPPWAPPWTVRPRAVPSSRGRQAWALLHPYPHPAAPQHPGCSPMPARPAHLTALKPPSLSRPLPCQPRGVILLKSNPGHVSLPFKRPTFPSESNPKVSACPSRETHLPSGPPRPAASWPRLSPRSVSCMSSVSLPDCPPQEAGCWSVCSMAGPQHLGQRPAPGCAGGMTGCLAGSGQRCPPGGYAVLTQGSLRRFDGCNLPSAHQAACLGVTRCATQ